MHLKNNKMNVELLANCCAYQNGYKKKLLLCEVNYLFRLANFCFERVNNDIDLIAAVKIIKKYFRLLGKKHNFKFKYQYVWTIYRGLTNLPISNPANNYGGRHGLVKLTLAELNFIKKKTVRVLTHKEVQEKLKKYFLYVPPICQSPTHSIKESRK